MLKLILGLICLIVFLTLISNLYNSYKINKLIKSRKILTKGEFVKMLVNKGFDINDVEIVYDEIIKYITNKKFSLYPEDDLYRVVQIDEFEDNELLNSIFNKLELKIPAQEYFDKLNLTSKSFDSIYILELIKTSRNIENSKLKI